MWTFGVIHKKSREGGFVKCPYYYNTYFVKWSKKVRRAEEGKKIPNKCPHGLRTTPLHQTILYDDDHLETPSEDLGILARHEMMVVKHQHMECQANDGLHP